MKKLQYTVSVLYDVIGSEDGEILDTESESEYYDTREEAHAAAAQYHAGQIIGEYGDGAKCVVQSVTVGADPEPVEFFD
jgi:hypothetical protein